MPGQEKALGCTQDAAEATPLLRPNDPADPMEHRCQEMGGFCGKSSAGSYWGIAEQTVQILEQSTSSSEKNSSPFEKTAPGLPLGPNRD